MIVKIIVLQRQKIQNFPKKQFYCFCMEPTNLEAVLVDQQLLGGVRIFPAVEGRRRRQVGGRGGSVAVEELDGPGAGLVADQVLELARRRRDQPVHREEHVRPRAKH